MAALLWFITTFELDTISLLGCSNKRSKVVLEDFLIHLANYFYWYFEAIDSKILTNPMCM